MTKAEKLSGLLSEILDAVEADHPRFRPMEPRVPEGDRRTAYVRLMKQLGIRYRRCDFNGYRVYEEKADGRVSQQEVFTALVEMAEDLPDRLQDGSGVVLFGRPGTGKDHLLVALAYSAILQWGYVVQWINGAGLYQQARQLIDDKGSEAAFILRFTESQILFISDPIPPKGETSRYGVDVLQRILDRRYRDCKSTWATLNVHDGQEAEARLASPITSRLRHGSLCLRCDWADYREARKL